MFNVSYKLVSMFVLIAVLVLAGCGGGGRSDKLPKEGEAMLADHLESNYMATNWNLGYRIVATQKGDVKAWNSMGLRGHHDDEVWCVVVDWDGSGYLGEDTNTHWYVLRQNLAWDITQADIFSLPEDFRRIGCSIG